MLILGKPDYKFESEPVKEIHSPWILNKALSLYNIMRMLCSVLRVTDLFLSSI